MARRTPGQRRLVRPVDRREGLGIDPGDLMLQKVEGQIAGESLVAFESGEGRPLRAEAVHQEQRQPDVLPTAKMEHLPGDQIEEGRIPAHGQQTLRPRQPHGRAEPTVQLHDHGAGERLPSGAFEVAKRVCPGQRFDGVDRVLGNGRRPALANEADRAEESANRDLGHPCRLHALAMNAIEGIVRTCHVRTSSGWGTRPRRLRVSDRSSDPVSSARPGAAHSCPDARGIPKRLASFSP